MRKRTAVPNWLVLGILFILPSVATCAPPDSRRLRYPVSQLGDATAPQIASPGFQSDCALRLSCHLKNWARWNLPLFAPDPQTESIRFHARREGDEPRQLLVRALESDGSEWSAGPFPLTEKWNELRVLAKDFRYFRSRDARKGHPIRMNLVTQVQFVPVARAKDRKAAVLLDNVRVEPNGPRWTFEKHEHARTISREEALDAQCAFITATHQAQMQHARAHLEWLRNRALDLQTLAATATPSQTFQDILARHGDKARRRDFAFQKPAPEFKPPSDADETLRKRSLEALNKRAETFSAPPLALDVDTPKARKRWRNSRLYAAAEQTVPAFVPAENGASAVSQSVRFAATDRQVVFLHLALPEPIDIAGRYDTIRFRARLSDNAIHPEEGITIRLFSKGGNNAWMDRVAITPEKVQPRKWQTWEVALHRFEGRNRFDSSQFTALSFRIENPPGRHAEFDFAVSAIEIACARPRQLAMAAIRRDQKNELAQLQLRTLALYDTIHQTTRNFPPPLRRFRLWADMQHPEPADPAPQATPASDLAAPLTKSGEGLLRVEVQGSVPRRPRAGAGHLSLNLRCATPQKVHHYDVALFDHADQCVYAKRLTPNNAGHAALEDEIDGIHYWWPGYPYLYTLRVAAFDEKGPIDALQRETGFCTVVYRESDVSGAMRHARVSTPRDWSAWINAQPWFPQGSRATLAGADDDRQPTGLLQELWVEFQRNYGSRPAHALSDALQREGIMETCSLRARYNSIANYSDALLVADSYRTSLRRMRDRLLRPHILHYAVGNEVELNVWGADLAATFGDDIWQPLETSARAVRDILGRNRPVSYIRAGQFNRVPDLPSDDMAGVNHYPGRYYGRVEQIPEDLANLSLNTLLRGWPLYIGEWNGPKYTWASTGIGGSTERGCAVYISKYWDAMTRTPGVALSSEFVLNWVATAIEDLTTVPVEEGMKRRGKYNQFGGGRTAGHVPWIFPDRLDRGHTFDYMQGFHSPLHYLLETPGPLAILHAPRASDAAQQIADPLRAIGKIVRIEPLTDKHDIHNLDTHLLILGEIGPAQPALIRNLQDRRVIGAVLPGFPRAGFPLIQKRVHPAFPDRMIVTVAASDATGYATAIERLRKAAESLLRIQREAAATRRLVVFADKAKRIEYQSSFNEFSTRGFFHDFDDFRSRIDPTELLDDTGRPAPRFATLGAVVVDLERALDASERATLRKLNASGVHILLTLPCYQANPALQTEWRVRAGNTGALTESIPVAESWQTSLKVPEMGHARPDRMRPFVHFKANELESTLRVTELSGPGWQPVARRKSTDGAVVVAGNPWSKNARCFVFGCDLREIVRLHRKVTRSGKTHNLYDRGTACGLERVARVAVNCLRAQMPLAENAADLRGRIETDRSLVAPSDALRVALSLTDAADRPVAGAAVLISARYGKLFANMRGARGARSEDYLLLKEDPTQTGRYTATIRAGDPKDGDTLALGAPKTDAAPGAQSVIVQLKALKKGHPLYEGAAAAVLAP